MSPERRDRVGAVFLPGFDGEVGGAAAQLEDAGLGVGGDPGRALTHTIAAVDNG